MLLLGRSTVPLQKGKDRVVVGGGVILMHHVGCSRNVGALGSRKQLAESVGQTV
jgi:hypothetical protein